jgi:hypothetical protein
MSDSERDPELAELLADLTTTLRELQEEVEPDRPPRPRLPTPEGLSQFTSEVAIPGLILILQTNIRALQLLQRAIRLANGRDPSPDGTVSDVRSRAEQVGKASLSQLDTVLDDLQSALESRPEDEDARELLSRARNLHEEVREELDADGTSAEFDDGSQPVDIDIESELQSIKDHMDEDEDEDDDDEGSGGAGGDSNPDDT